MENSFIQKYLFFLVHLKGLMRGFGNRYYSQWGEDVVLKNLFSRQKRGFYVDVGAYHPMHYSNTALLYKKGWSGINIDPNPSSIALFNLHRRRDRNINCGIAGEVTKKPYFIFNHQSCNTFSEQQKKLMESKSFIRLLETREVDCVPLNKILKDNPQSYNQIDLLNIDVEGLNFEVLNTFDWSTLPPRIICIEDDYLSFSEEGEVKSEVFDFLYKKSYVLYAKVGLSCIYTLKDFEKEKSEISISPTI